MGSMPERLNIKVKPADPMELREQDLIRRVQAGEKELFYDLVKPYERRIYTAAFAVLRNEAEAEDAAQEAMLKALIHIRQFRAEARFSTWLRLVFSNSSSSAIMEPEKIFSSAPFTRNAAAARTLGVWNREPVSTAL